MTCQNPMYHFWAKSLSKLCYLITKRWHYNSSLFGSSLLLLICMIQLYPKPSWSIYQSKFVLREHSIISKYIHSFFFNKKIYCRIITCLPSTCLFMFLTAPHEAFINLGIYVDLQAIFNFLCVKLSVNIDEIIFP